MDEDLHKYKFLSYVNVTSPIVTQTYPQFMIESIMKTALDDDDFEFKVRQTPFPAPLETTEVGNYLTAFEMSKLTTLLTMSDNVTFWGKVSWQASGTVVFTWILLNSYFMLQTIRDRVS